VNVSIIPSLPADPIITVPLRPVFRSLLFVRDSMNLLTALMPRAPITRPRASKLSVPFTTDAANRRAMGTHTSARSSAALHRRLHITFARVAASPSERSALSSHHKSVSSGTHHSRASAHSMARIAIWNHTRMNRKATCLCMCVNVCVDQDMCVYTYLHTYIHIYIYTHTIYTKIPHIQTTRRDSTKAVHISDASTGEAIFASIYIHTFACTYYTHSKQ
jgi:hypothetical protein